jgi:hypothetical protein
MHFPSSETSGIPQEGQRSPLHGLIAERQGAQTGHEGADREGGRAAPQSRHERGNAVSRHIRSIEEGRAVLMPIRRARREVALEGLRP